VHENKMMIKIFGSEKGYIRGPATSLFTLPEGN
jgi:hypothetical protein